MNYYVTAGVLKDYFQAEAYNYAIAEKMVECALK